MKLPDTNAITLPDSNEDWFALEPNETEGALSVWDVAELRRRFLPAYLQGGIDPVRDAFLVALATMSNRARADMTRIMAAGQSPRFAWGPWLKAWGFDRHLPQMPDESDGDYRQRLMDEPVGIAPKAIRDAVRALFVGRFAPKALPVFVEPLADYAFWRSASAPPSAPACYWQSRAPGHGRIWASGRRTGLRTVGAYWTSAAQIPKLWALLPTTLSSKRGFYGSVNGLAPTAFWGRATGPGAFYHTVRTSVETTKTMSAAVAALSSRVLAGVQWMIVADPALTYSIAR